VELEMPAFASIVAPAVHSSPIVMDKIKENCSYGEVIGGIDPIMTVQRMD
jgi:hypothetical protein